MFSFDGQTDSKRAAAQGKRESVNPWKAAPVNDDDKNQLSLAIECINALEKQVKYLQDHNERLQKRNDILSEANIALLKQGDQYELKVANDANQKELVKQKALNSTLQKELSKERAEKETLQQKQEEIGKKFKDFMDIFVPAKVTESAKQYANSINLGQQAEATTQAPVNVVKGDQTPRPLRKVEPPPKQKEEQVPYKYVSQPPLNKVKDEPKQAPVQQGFTNYRKQPVFGRTASGYNDFPDTKTVNDKGLW